MNCIIVTSAHGEMAVHAVTEQDALDAVRRHYNAPAGEDFTVVSSRPLQENK